MIITLRSLLEFVPALMQAAGREYSCDVKAILYRNRQMLGLCLLENVIHLCVSVGQPVLLPRLEICVSCGVEKANGEFL